MCAFGDRYTVPELRCPQTTQVDPGTGLQPLEETFTYDALNRVKTSSVTNQPQKTYAYDTLGNITSKTGIGSYTYSGVNAGPHAVTTAGSFDYLYDANGNQTEKKSGVTVARDITYTAFNKPKKITKGGTWVEFTYGADRARIKQVDDSGTELIYVAGSVRYERKTKTGGATEHLHYLAVGGEVISIYQSQGTVSGGSETPVAEKQTYLHRDHLGSVVVITDDTGAVLERLSYDVWGKRRDHEDWDGAPKPTHTHNETHRGYTGHEMLDSVGLVHMNGRVYDPDLARFTSADPFIQFADNPQSLNRYSYVLNNPLSFTDPSGFFIGSLFKGLKSIFKGIVKAVKAVVKAVVRSIRAIGAITAAIVVTKLTGCPACGGFVAGLISGDGDIKSGLIGAATAAAFGTLHFKPVGLGQKAFKVIAHGVVGGVSQELQGGSFLSGFLAGGATQAFSLSGGFEKLGVTGDPTSFEDYAQNAAVAALVGGTASVIGGGKFQSGAVTGAYSRLFNDLSESQRNNAEIGTIKIPVFWKTSERKIEGEWYTVFALGDGVAELIAAANHPLARALAVTIDIADLLNVQARDVSMQQINEFRLYHFKILRDAADGYKPIPNTRESEGKFYEEILRVPVGRRYPSGRDFRVCLSAAEAWCSR